MENKDVFRIFGQQFAQGVTDRRLGLRERSELLPSGSLAHSPWRTEVIPELQQYSPQFVDDLLTAFEERVKHHPDIVAVWRGYLIYMARRRWNIWCEINMDLETMGLLEK